LYYLNVRKTYKNNTKGEIYMAEVEYASKGLAGAGLGTGVAGLALGVLNGGLNGILGGGCNNGWNHGCSENNLVNRYELNMQTELAAKDGKIALLESNIYTDQKLNDLRNYVDARMGAAEGAINAQAVYNATQTATISCIQNQVAQLFGLTKLVVPNTSVCPGYSN
jgi:hypothetical protein